MGCGAVRGRQQGGAGSGDPAGGQSAEEREAALAEAVRARMEELRRLSAYVQRLR